MSTNKRSDSEIARELQQKLVTEEKAKAKAREQEMIKRALAQSEADMQVKKQPQDAAPKRGLGRRNQAEPVDEYHPDDAEQIWREEACRCTR